MLRNAGSSVVAAAIFAYDQLFPLERFQAYNVGALQQERLVLWISSTWFCVGHDRYKGCGTETTASGIIRRSYLIFLSILSRLNCCSPLKELLSHGCAFCCGVKYGNRTIDNLIDNFRTALLHGLYCWSSRPLIFGWGGMVNRVWPYVLPHFWYRSKFCSSASGKTSKTTENCPNQNSENAKVTQGDLWAYPVVKVRGLGGSAPCSHLSPLQ